MTSVSRLAMQLLVGCVAGCVDGCVDGTPILEVRDPAAASVIVVSFPGGAPRAWAVDNDDGSDFFTFPAPEQGASYALIYEQRLGELGFVEGLLDLSAIDLLPIPSRVLSGVEVLDRPVAPLPQELSDLIQREPEKCMRLESTNVELPVVDKPRSAIRIGPNEVLVGGDDGQTVFVSPEGARETGWSTTTPSLGGLLQSDGTLWLVGVDGRVVKGGRDGVFEQVPSLSRGTGDEFMRMVGDPGGGTELYVLSQSGHLERFDGVAWSVLAEAEVAEPGRAPLAWIEPGHLVATTLTQGAVTRIRDGVISLEVPLEGTFDLPLSVAALPGPRVALGSVAGKVLISDAPDQWSSLGDSILALPVKVIASMGAGGFVFGGSGGVLAHYTEENGYCPPMPYVAEEVTTLVTLEDYVFVLESSANPSFGTFLHSIR